MTFFYGASGLLLLVAVNLDVLFTAVATNRAGMISRSVAAVAWRVICRLTPALGRPNWMYRSCGLAIMSSVAVVWILLISLGWMLFFRSDPLSLEMAETGEPAGWWYTYAFVGSALSTVGASNAKTASALWDIFAMVAAVNGMVVLTMSVSFVLGVTQTVIRGRAFCALAGSLDPADRRNVRLFLPSVVHLCASLRSTPLALYYSAVRPSRRIPETLVHFAERAAETPEALEAYSHALSDLPGLGLTEGETVSLSRLRIWCRQYSLDDGAVRPEDDVARSSPASE